MAKFAERGEKKEKRDLNITKSKSAFRVLSSRLEAIEAIEAIEATGYYFMLGDH